jgi:hypothetical protein
VSSIDFHEVQGLIEGQTHSNNLLGLDANAGKKDVARSMTFAARPVIS